MYATKVEEPYSKLLHNLHVCTSTFSLRCMMFTLMMFTLMVELQPGGTGNCNLVGLALSVYVNRGLLFPILSMYVMDVYIIRGLGI